MKVMSFSVSVLCLAALSGPVLGQRARVYPTDVRARLFVDRHELLVDGELSAQVPAAVSGDLDGDGHLDLVVSQESYGWVSGTLFPHRSLVYLNDGGGVLRVRLEALPDHGHAALDIGLGDLDGDGDLDLIFAVYGAQPRLYLNDGSGTFSEPTAGIPPLHVASDLHYGVELGDVDGDGDLDALWGHPGFGSRLYLNDGSAHFVEAAEHPPAFYTRFGDVDADGDLDIVAHGMGLFSNDGTGLFPDAASPIPGAGGDFELGDLDGDGDLDIAGLGFAKLNDGSGTFTPQTISPWLGPVALVDVDGDGDLDLLNAEHLLLNAGDGSFSGAPAQIPPFPDSLTAQKAGDFDGDGDVDLFVARKFFADYHSDGFERYLLLNDGLGTFLDAGILTNEFPRGLSDFSFIGCRFTGDIDGDGFPDLFEACESYGAPKLSLNDGTGHFEPFVTLPYGGSWATGFEVADLDGDGDRDVVFIGGDRVRWYRNEGLSFSIRNTPADGYQYRLDIGDIEGDGDLDVVTAGDCWYILRNDGSGTFSSEQFTVSTEDVRFIDVERDGDLDILYAQWGRLQLLVNHGPAGFVNESAARLSGGGCGVSVGDVDGDGDPDILSTRLSLNDGAGFFVDASHRLGEVPESCSYPYYPQLADVDGDGDLDAVLSTFGLWNDGTGRFLERFEFGGGVALDHFDLDGDGDLELLPWWRRDFNLPVNTTRQIAWHAPPGRDQLRIDLFGPPGKPWILNYALAPAYLPSSFGTLFLDPATLTPAGAGVLNPHGRDAFRMLVPADASLVGTTLHWQALVGSPPRFTNRETTTFTNL